ALSATVGTVYKFTATLTDAANVQRTGVFRLNALPVTNNLFRFAIDRLSEAKVGQDYVTNVQVLNGDANTKFSVVANSVTVTGGGNLANLEANGLTLFEDGTIAGRPLKSGTLMFVARATRTGGILALNRQGTAPDQLLTINI